MKPAELYLMNFIEACNWLSYFKEYDEFVKKEEDRMRGKQTF